MLDKQSCATSPVPVKMEKHIQLDLAIKDLQDLQFHTSDILRRIKGVEQITPPVSVEIPKEPNVTLLSVLLEGPDRIRTTCNETHNLLDEINQILF